MRPRDLVRRWVIAFNGFESGRSDGHEGHVRDSAVERDDQLVEAPQRRRARPYARTVAVHRMRVHIGEIPESPEFVPDESWTLLAEPTPWAMQLMALPIGVVAMAVLGVLWMERDVGPTKVGTL